MWRYKVNTLNSPARGRIVIINFMLNALHASAAIAGEVVGGLVGIVLIAVLVIVIVIIVKNKQESSKYASRFISVCVCLCVCAVQYLAFSAVSGGTAEIDIPCNNNMVYGVCEMAQPQPIYESVEENN